MTNLIAAALFLLVFAVVVVALERVHRHDGDLPRAPFGVDADGDADLRRVLHDLDARP